MTDDTDVNGAVRDGLEAVRHQIGEAEIRYSRQPGSVQLLAVSKRKPVEAIRAAMEAGQNAFGENYVDEGVEKILTIDNPALEWHYIGAIQSRKCAAIARHFHWAHGVDRLKVAKKLAENRPANMPALNICLQVNLDNEPGKAGASLEQIPELLQACAGIEGLTIRGLMAIPAPRAQLPEQRAAFAQLGGCMQALQVYYPDLDTLSMGMSADMEAAIAEGATIVRVGTAIFGQRDR